MIPGRLLIAVVFALGLAGVVVAAVPGVSVYWLGAGGLLVLAAAADLFAIWRTPVPEVERTVPGSLPLATWSQVRLLFRNTKSARSVTLRVYDHHPDFFRTRGLPFRITVAAGHFVEAEYTVRAEQRGAGRFPRCELRLASPMRLWWLRRFAAVESEVRVYPNYSTITKLLAFEVDNRWQLAGLRLSRRRGEGIEFHQLREYRDGDSLRSIDWKATARTTRLISREYQDERDQQIVFLLDCGRRMLAKDGELSHFDHALNAMLLLSYVALRQGDAVGVMTIGDDRGWLAPRKGAAAINAILNHVYDVQPRPVEVDYVSAATDLSVRQRRRGLVVLLSNFREEDQEDLRLVIDLLQRRHLLMLASLRERILDDTLAADIHGFDDALAHAATNQYLDARREAHKLLRARGVFVDDCLSDQLPAAITNRYLSIKRAGLL